MRKGFIRAGAAGLAVGLLASCGSGGRGGAYEECDPDYTSSVKASEEEIADALAFGDSYIADPEAETGFNHWGGDYVRLPGEVACIGADDEKYFTIAGLAVYRSAIQNPESGIEEPALG